MSLRAAPLALGEETLEPNEEALIDRLVQLHRDAQEAGDAHKRPVPHGQHPKHQGCVRAEFTVEPALPDEVRHGLFAEPRTYQAYIRFSNGVSDDDRAADVHGMAIKLLDVPGERVDGSPSDSTHDFVMISHPVFFVKNLSDYIQVLQDFKSIKSPGLSFGKAGAFFKLLLSQDYRYRGIRETLAKIDDPLRVQYWSTTPYKLGAGAMKFSARPLLTDGLPAAGAGKDKLREAMAAHLAGREARFDFLVQRQTDAHATPIEDPTVEWRERDAPFVKVARIVIPSQTFTTPELMALAENLSFTPWHALAAHRPLGGVNRARRRVYDAISQRRHELNGAPMVEPK